jgi:type II secretory pathway component GspD/PulD (secretin)
MSKNCGGSLIIGALVALIGATSAVAEPHRDIGHEKISAVSPFEGEVTGRVGLESYTASVDRASSLLGIHADSATSNPTVQLNFSTLPTYVFSMNENSLVVYFANAIVLNDLERMYIDGGSLVTAVTASQSMASPLFLTEVVLNTNRSFSVKTKTIGDSLHIELFPRNPELDRAFKAQQELLASSFMTSVVAESQARHAARLTTLGDQYAQLSQRLDGYLDTAKLIALEHELTQMTPVKNTHSRHNTSIALLSNGVSTLKESFDLDRLTYREMAPRAASFKLTDGLSLVDEIQVRSSKMSDLMNRLEITLENMKTKTAAAQRLVSQTNQVAASGRVPNVNSNGLARLDRAVAELRTTSPKSSSNDIDALELAINSVSAAQPNLEIAVSTNAAIRLTDAEQSALGVSPPARRSRPAVHSLTASKLRSPDRMTTLVATQEEMSTALDQGMLVMAQATSTSTLTDSTPPGTIATEPTTGIRRLQVQNSSRSRPNFNLYNKNVLPEDDPLRRPVNIDFKDMDLANVVSLLAQKGQIDVIASVDLSGKVTASLTNIPLGRAIEVVLRMNDLGIIEETGIYRITTYEEAVSSRQDTEMIFLQQAEASAVKATLDEIVSQGSAGGGARVRIGVNTQSNILILSGPRERVNDLVEIIRELDVAEPVLPTQNKVFRLNHADPSEVVSIISPILSENGQATGEIRSGQVIVTDIPVKIAEITELIAEIDIAVEQVSIEAMVVDNFISDGAQIGGSLLMTANSLNPLGILTESFTSNNPAGLSGGSQEADGGIATSVTLGQGASIGFGFVHNKSLLFGQLQAQITSNDAVLLANPVVVTLENEQAEINITTSYPYTETMLADGIAIATTIFKDIGTILLVTPQITFDNQINIDITAEESTILGANEFGAPISALRKAKTKMRMDSGQTVYIAGLRRLTTTETQAKVPVLGSIPILGLLFRSTVSDTQNSELMIFLTCSIVGSQFDELTPYQKERYDTLGGIDPNDINGTRDMLKSYGRNQLRDPIYKWKRAK